MKMATLDGRLDLRELEPLAAAKFDKRALTTRFAVDARREHVRRVRAAAVRPARHRRRRRRRQGAAAAGPHPGRPAGPDRRRAVQGNGPRAARHIRRRRQRRQALRRPRHGPTRRCRPPRRSSTHSLRLPQLWDEREQARADEKLIDTFGAGRPGDTPFLLWQLRTRDQLLDSAARAALKSRSLLEERCRAARTEHSRLKGELARVEGEQRAAGGDTIKRLRDRDRGRPGRP